MDLSVEGAGQFVERLSRFDQGVYKILMTGVKDAADLVANDAKSNVTQELRNWGSWKVTTGRNARLGPGITSATGQRDLSFTVGKVRSSIKPSARKARARGVGTVGVVGLVRMTNAGGTIFSTAGGAKRGASTNSVFVRNLRRKAGENYPRLLGPAWERKGPEAGKRIDKELDDAKRRLGL